jgi:predicted AlkP superfamily phosphohydrolase/phosphomutase
LSRTVLIGLDGATFSVLDPLMGYGVMPFLREFVHCGTRAELLSTLNPLTPPAWTSLMTGRSPGHHGVFDFLRAEERNGDMFFTLSDGRDVQCETIWSMVSGQKMRVTSLNFPMMYPHPPVSGCIVPGLVSWKNLKLGVQPPSLYQELKAIPGLNLKEMGWDWELGKKVVLGIEPTEYESWVELHIKREHHWFEVARHLMQTGQCDLTAVLFDGVDKLQHICWNFLGAEWTASMHSTWENKIRDLCLDYFRQLDSYIREIVRLAGPQSRIFIASDHGFGPSGQVFCVNVWLQERGYLTWRVPAAADPATAEKWKRRLNSSFVLLDWERTKAYARTPSSNGIFIRKSERPGQSGVPPEEYERFRQELTDGLYNIVDPATGEHVVKDVWKREEAFPGNHSRQAPDLTLVLRDYGFVSIKNGPAAVQARPRVIGTHRPEGILLAAGVGLRRDTTMGALSILDVASNLLYSLGLEIPRDLEGRVAFELFEPSWVEANPVRIGEPTRTAESQELRAEARQTEPDDQSTVVERLRALGYIE